MNPPPPPLRIGPSDDERVTRCLIGVRLKVEEDIAEIWSISYPSMFNLCRRRLGHSDGDYEGAEDAVISAFQKLVINLQAGKYPNALDGESYMKLLTRFTLREANKIRRRQQRRGRLIVRESDVLRFDFEHDHLTSLAVDRHSSDDTSDLTNFLNDQDVQSQRIAKLRIAGWPIKKIAASLNLSHTTVRRKLHQLMVAWQKYRQV